MAYGRKPRTRRRSRRRFKRRTIVLGNEAKLATYTQDVVQYPDAAVSAHTSPPASQTEGGIEGGTASPNAQFQFFLRDQNNTEPDGGHPKAVQFGSRARVVYNATAGVPPAGASGSTITDHPVDGSFPIVLIPANYDGTNNVKMEQYTGRKFATTGVGGKITFFHSSGHNFSSNGLWDHETIIDVYLLRQKEGTQAFTRGDDRHRFVTATDMFLGDNYGNASAAERDLWINSYINPDSKNRFDIIRKWRLELSGGNDSSEPFLPFEFYHKFKTPLVTEMDKDADNHAQGVGSDILKNRLQLLFVARGAVEMTYEIRQYFRDI